MKMTPVVRWLMVTSFVLVLCASASAAQSTSHSHKPASHSRKSHPSHPMRNNRPKHHAMDTTRTSLLAVRYLQPQQASSVVAANSSGSASASKSSAHTSPASSKKKSSSKKSRHSRREPTQKAPTPERISEIQSSLARGGYYQGEPNGKWDASTVAAMQKFQSANGLDPSGKLDATSLQKLGLGSGIAGVSAPRQPTPAQGKSCCSTSPNGTAPATSAPAAPASAPKSSSEPSASASPITSSGSNATASASTSAASASTATASAATNPTQR
jgi:peptidoglycan hydrolase-like protein with peptidoglycan-binding domain